VCGAPGENYSALFSSPKFHVFLIFIFFPCEKIELETSPFS
jgi:hypothetical protein